MDGLRSYLLERVEKAEKLAPFTFEVTSGFRDGDDGEHGLGEAVDVMARSGWVRFKIVEAALAAGFTRIGVYDRHVHLGVSEAFRFPQEVMWVGVSK